MSSAGPVNLPSLPESIDEGSDFIQSGFELIVARSVATADAAFAALAKRWARNHGDILLFKQAMGELHAAQSKFPDIRKGVEGATGRKAG